jgi:hypothetical protein
MLERKVELLLPEARPAAADRTTALAGARCRYSTAPPPLPPLPRPALLTLTATFLPPLPAMAPFVLVLLLVLPGPAWLAGAAVGPRYRMGTSAVGSLLGWLLPGALLG